MKNNKLQKEIPRNWFETTLEKECDILKGQGLSKGKILENGKKECILYGELYTTYREVINVIKSHTDSEEGIRSKSGDILIPASTTTVAKDLAIATALNKDNVLLGGDINILRKKKNSYDPNFLAYYLTHYKNKELSGLAQGITIIHLYGKDFKQLNICIPKSVKEQQKIAEILMEIDRDITKTQKVIKIAEKLKRGLMQQLFALGIVHTKFKKMKIGELCEFKYGFSLPETKRQEGSITVYGSNGKIDSHNIKGVDGPVIIVGRKGTIGAVTWSEVDCWPIDTTYYIEEGDYELRWLYYLLIFLRLNKMNTASGTPGLNREEVYSRNVNVPYRDEQKRIAEILSAVDEKISINKKLKANLILLKKGLMQDLLSGKVRVI